MRIGIDVDGVLTNLDKFVIDYFSKYCIENNIDYNVVSNDYQLYKAFNVDKKVVEEFWDKYLDIYAKNVTPRQFASEVVKKLKSDGNEIYIVTARWLTNRDDEVGENMRNCVKDWLKKYDIYFDKLVFTKATNENKQQEMIDNKIDIMIEDNPNNINMLSSLLPVICFDIDYNRVCSGKNIIRCYSWYDIYKTIRNIQNNK